MSPDRDAEIIRRICQEALDRPAAERAQFVSDACAGDDRLRREIEALLALDASIDGFLATPALEIEAERLAAAEAGARRALVGRRLGAYEILSPIGSGGMGEVYRAHDTRLRRDVAIKLLPSVLANDPDRLARLEREARLLAALNHPHIATIHGLEDADGIRALVMELVEGPTLAEKLLHGTRRGVAAALPLTDALDIARQLAEALAAAHDKGIVHRDLKPANIKIGGDGRVKVLDFGLAKAVPNEIGGAAVSQLASTVTTDLHAGVVAGTPAYMSPEQARGLAVDTRADIWAFGCVLFEMLAGRKAFSRETVSDTIASILEREPDWTALPPATPPNIRRVLAHCLEKDPTRRWRDIGDVRIELDDIERVPAGSGVERTVSTARERRAWAGGGARNRRRAWITASVAALVAAALAAFAYQRAREPTADRRPMRFQIPPVVDVAASGNLGLSPDGRHLAFVGVGADGIPRIFMRAIDSLDVRPLPGTETQAATPPPFFWSPDSRFIAFYSGRQLKKVDIAGGPPQALCDLPGFAVGGSWNRSGDIVVGNVLGGLVHVRDTGGATSAVTVLDASKQEEMHLLPTFLPDGRHFVYLRVSSRMPEKSGVYVGTLDAKPGEQTSQRLMPYAIGATYIGSTDPERGRLLFIREGTLLAQPFDAARLALAGDPLAVAEHVGVFRDTGSFSASSTGVLVYRTTDTDFQLSWADRSGLASGSISEPGRFRTAALSPDGGRVVASRTNAQDSAKADLWLFDLSRGSGATRLTLGAGLAEFPLWSRDGQRIVYILDKHAFYQQRATAETGDAEKLYTTESAGVVEPDDASPDGRFVLYSATHINTARWGQFVLPLARAPAAAAAPQPIPVARSPDAARREFDEHQGRFSPDGRWIAYVSNESGADEIYVRAFSTDAAGAPDSAGGRILVSNGGGTSPRWRGDGRELFYVARDGKMMAVDVATATEFQRGTPRTLFQVPPGATLGDVAADGRRFLLLTPIGPATTAPFTVVVNWTETLKE